MAMTRRDKYGTECDVEKYHCGSCANYEFEDDNEKNKCTHYYQWFYKDDKCESYWEESSEVIGTEGGCFLTTACCEYYGLPDNCSQLETMRDFRDNILDKTMVGRRLKMHYYEVAPKLLEKLEEREDKDTILAWLYGKINNIVELVKTHQNKQAISDYIITTLEFEEKVES